MARKRIIRKQPLFDKIRSYPLDLFLSLNESRLSVDWDDYIPQSLPAGTLLSLVFLVLTKLQNHYSAASDRRDNSVFRTDSSTYDQVMARAIHGSAYQSSASFVRAPRSVTSTLQWINNVALAALFVAATLNALTVYFVPFRNYTLLSRTADSPKPKGSNVFRQSVSSANPTGLFSKVYSYFNEASYYETDTESDADTTYEAEVVEKKVWVLQVWDPSRFSLYMALSFSPVSLSALWMLASAVAVWKLALFLSLFNACAFYTVTKFFQLVADKQIIYQETFNEYNKKYVIPKTSVLRKNAMVDATHGPRAAASLVAHHDAAGHLQNDYAFITHDIHGNRKKSVRADALAIPSSRPASPSKQLPRYSNFMANTSRGTRYNAASADFYDRSHYNDASDHSWVTSSTPYTGRGGVSSSFLHRNDPFGRANDTFSRGTDAFSRPSSRAPSPMKSPSRFSYNSTIPLSQRTQLSPGKTSRPPSPHRSPSPSKRPWF